MNFKHRHNPWGFPNRHHKHGECQCTEKRAKCNVCPDPCPKPEYHEPCDDPCLKEKIDVKVGVDVVVDECDPFNPDVKVTLDVDVIDCCKRPCACFDVDPNVTVRIIEEKPHCKPIHSKPIQNFTKVCR